MGGYAVIMRPVFLRKRCDTPREGVGVFDLRVLVESYPGPRLDADEARPRRDGDFSGGRIRFQAGEDVRNDA